jgi:glycosyltransferase involved in cell wall biosynthesis
VLSIIIPTCNRPEDLAKCLEQLAIGISLTTLSSAFEIIVSDDGRKKPAKELCETQFPWVRWKLGPAKGPGANRNHGASVAVNPWLLFIDDDCTPAHNLLQAYLKVIKTLNKNDWVVIEGPTIRTEEPPSLLWEAPHNPEGKANISANFAITAYSFNAAGRFDERYRRAAFEDTEFFSRFRCMEGKFIFVKDATVYHPLRPIPSSRSLAERWEGKLILSLDQGAPISMALWRLPLHALRVIQSRFRNKKMSRDNCKALLIFVLEWLFVLRSTVPWILRWTRTDRSKFWRAHSEKFGPPPKYGF